MKLNEDLDIMKKEVGNIQEEQHSLAYELISECKKKAKRDFITIIILSMMIFLFNIIWIWYINQFDYTDEQTIIDSGDGTATYLENSESGDISYGEN